MFRFLFSLVGFPFLAVVVAPIHGFLKALGWAFANGLYLLGFPVLAPTVGRIWNARGKHEGLPVGLAAMYTIMGGVVLLMTFVSQPTTATKEFWSNYQNIILAIVGTNLFSALYEFGRLYHKKVIRKEKSEAPGKPSMTVTTATGVEFCKLLDAVLDQWECTKEQAEAFRKSLNDLEAGGKVTVNAATMLRKEITARETEDITEAQEVPAAPVESKPAPYVGDNF